MVEELREATLSSFDDGGGSAESKYWKSYYAEALRLFFQPTVDSTNTVNIPVCRGFIVLPVQR